MVKTMFVILIISVLTLISCDIFFQTPFPDDLIYFKNSIDLTSEENGGIKGPVDEANLVFFKDLLILDIKEYQEDPRFFIFTKELELKLEGTGRVDSFIMEDTYGNYIIGFNYYDSNLASLPPISIENIPGQYGFSYNYNNYVLLFDRDRDSLSYRIYDEFWTNYTQYDVITGYRLDLVKAVYDNETGGQRVILFLKTDDWPYDLHIIHIPVTYFEMGLPGYGSYPFGQPSIIIRDSDPFECYQIKRITDSGLKDAYIVIDYDGRYLLYTETGEKIAEAKTNVEESIEAYNYEYNYEGEDITAVNVDRYIFSKSYLRLIKTKAWW